MLFLSEVKERGLDGIVQVTDTGCQGGPCSTGPTVLIYPEGVKYQNVKEPADISAIFDEHLLGDAPVNRLQVPKDVWG